MRPLQSTFKLEQTQYNWTESFLSVLDRALMIIKSTLVLQMILAYQHLKPATRDIAMQSIQCKLAQIGGGRRHKH